MVLDEAMAFADAENELALREGMVELLQGKTVLMIAHRLYSIGMQTVFMSWTAGDWPKAGPTRSFWIKMACMPIFGLFRMRRKSGR